MTESRGGSSQSSRRRRWDVKTKEPFKSSVAVQKPKPKPQKEFNKEIHKLSHTSDSVGEYVNESETDTLSNKLSKLLNEAAEKPIEYSSDESIHQQRIPSAPPLERNIDKVSRYKTKKSSKKSVSPEPITSPITEQLSKMNNDIISGKETRPQPQGADRMVLNKASSSTFNGNISTIYCEKLNNFIVSTESQFMQPQGESLSSDHELNTRASFAVFLQTGFRTFSVLCQGLLAGIVLTHCLMLLAMDDDIFIKNSTFTHSIYAVVYFLLSVSLVASFDRSDLSGQDACSANGIKVPWTALFYLASFIITVIMTQGDDFISNNENFSEAVQKEKMGTQHWWKVMSLVRSFFIILGWTSIVGDPHTDALRSRIATLI